MDRRHVLLEVRHAGHRFVGSAVPSFEDVELVVRRGEFVGIVGPSGGGKSTLLRVLVGLAAPTYGCVVRPSGLRVGYVPQVSGMVRALPLTVAQTVALSIDGRRHDRRVVRRRIDELLDVLGLGGLGGRHLATLSGGERHRVEIARALVGRPDLVVLDEPAAALAGTARRHLVGLLEGIATADDGPAVVITTHDVNGVAARLPRIVAFDRTVVADGPPPEVLHPYVLERTFGVPMQVFRCNGVPVVVESRPVGAVADSVV
ncbi:MAG: hypothetical protein RLZZ01_1099 [Actinomycetota bacterium]